MKIYNGLGETLKIINRAYVRFDDETGRYILNPEQAGTTVMSLILHREHIICEYDANKSLEVCYDTREVINDLGFPIFIDNIHLIDPLPTGYDIIIAEEKYAQEYKGMNNNLYTTRDNVYSIDGSRIIGCLSLTKIN